MKYDKNTLCGLFYPNKNMSMWSKQVYFPFFYFIENLIEIHSKYSLLSIIATNIAIYTHVDNRE